MNSGYYLNFTWILTESKLDTIWILVITAFYLDPNWILTGFYLVPILYLKLAVMDFFESCFK